MWTNLLRCSSLGKFQYLSGYKQTGSVMSGYQIQISSSVMIQQKQPGHQQISKSQQKWLCCASLNEVNISKNRRPTTWGFVRLAMQVPLSLSIESYLYSLQTSHVLSQVLPQQNTSHDTTGNLHFGNSDVLPSSLLPSRLFLFTFTSNCEASSKKMLAK